MNEAEQWTLRTPATLVAEWRAEVAALRDDHDASLRPALRGASVTNGYAHLKALEERIWLLEHLIALVEALKA